MRSHNKALFLSVTGLVIGMLISIQYKNVREVINNHWLSSQTARQLVNELEDLKKEKIELNDIVMKLEDEISKYEQVEFADNDMIKKVQEDLIKFRIISGEKTVEGPGISIIISEAYREDRLSTKERGEELEGILISSINILNISGAEAISINGERYTALTGIKYRDGGLFVGSSLITEPIEILVVGNYDVLCDALNLRFGVVWRINQEKYFQVDIKKQNNIIVPRYNKPTDYQYSQPILP